MKSIALPFASEWELIPGTKWAGSPPSVEAQTAPPVGPRSVSPGSITQSKVILANLDFGLLCNLFAADPGSDADKELFRSG